MLQIELQIEGGMEVCGDVLAMIAGAAHSHENLNLRATGTQYTGKVLGRTDFKCGRTDNAREASRIVRIGIRVPI
jgi:hypothetical protein